MNSIFTTPKVFNEEVNGKKCHYYPSPAVPSRLLENNKSSPHLEMITPKINLNEKWKCPAKAFPIPQKCLSDEPPDREKTDNKENSASQNAASCRDSCSLDNPQYDSVYHRSKKINPLYTHNGNVSPFRDKVPKPMINDDLAELLSNSCDTSAQSTTMSPVGLQWYLDRFRNAAPTHASKRKLTVTQSTKTSLSTQHSVSNVEETVISTSATEPADESDLSNFSSIDTSASSFFNLRVSDATTTSEDTLLEQIVFEKKQPTVHDSEVRMQSRARDVHSKRLSYSSQFEELFGKRFEEILEIVPSEIVNPATDEDDILFQWRLKRAMDEAKSNPVNDIPDHALYSKSPLNDSSELFWKNVQPENKAAAGSNFPPPSSPPRIVREIDCQTDKEMVTTSCQVEPDLISTQVQQGSDLRSNHIAQQNIVDGIPHIPTSESVPLRDSVELHVINTSETVACQKVSEILYEDIKEEEDYYDSVSSYSDLTEISDLDDLNDTVIPNISCHPEKQSAAETQVLNSKQKISDPEVQCDDELESVKPVPENEMLDDNKGESSQLLKGYLQNILDSFDDPILASFINQYDFVQERMRIVDQLIEEKQISGED